MCNRTISPKDVTFSNNWTRLNPDYETKLYDNEMCRTFLLNEYGELHANIFDFLVDGPIKADFWRICILYKYGGVYCDMDNVPLVSFCEFIEEDVDFVTCSSYSDFDFNPNLIMSTKECSFLKDCMEWYIRKYNKQDKYDYWDWSVMSSFTHSIHIDNYHKNDGIYYSNNMKIQIIKEVPGNHYYDAHNLYNNRRVFNNRHEGWNPNTHSYKNI